MRATGTQRIRHISERITSNAITMLNNHYYWDRLQEHRVSEYLTEIEERQMKVDLKLKQSERCVPLKLKEPKEEKMETLDKKLKELEHKVSRQSNTISKIEQPLS